MSDGRNMVYTPFSGISVGATQPDDVFNIIGTSAIQMRLWGWSITSAAVAAALTTLTLGFVSTVGTGGTVQTEQLADDNKGHGILGALITDVETPGTDAGRLQSYQWEQLGPLGEIYTPEMAPICKPAEGFSLVATTSLALTLSGWACWEEILVA